MATAQANDEQQPFDEYVPNGQVQGDDRAMPNRGTATGVTDNYGADLSADATNRIGSITGATKSDGKDFA